MTPRTQFLRSINSKNKCISKQAWSCLYVEKLPQLIFYVEINVKYDQFTLKLRLLRVAMLFLIYMPGTQSKEKSHL